MIGVYKLFLGYILLSSRIFIHWEKNNISWEGEGFTKCSIYTPVHVWKGKLQGYIFTLEIFYPFKPPFFEENIIYFLVNIFFSRPIKLYNWLRLNIYINLNQLYLSIEMQRLKSLFIDFFRGPEVTNVRWVSEWVSGHFFFINDFGYRYLYQGWGSNFFPWILSRLSWRKKFRIRLLIRNGEKNIFLF